MNHCQSPKENIVMPRSVRNLLVVFIADERGLSAVEYGLLAAGIAVGLWTFISGIGGSLQTIFGSVQNDLSGATTGGGGTG